MSWRKGVCVRKEEVRMERERGSECDKAREKVIISCVRGRGENTCVHDTL